MSKRVVLQPREGALLKSAFEHYEAKKYKEALGEVEQILKKAPDHGESHCLKGLVLYHLKQLPEAKICIEEGLKLSPQSSVAWHMAGIYYKLLKNFPQAYNAYLQSYKIERSHASVQQDLAMLSMQQRKFGVLVDVRSTILNSKPNVHMSWLGLATAQHMNKDYAGAEKTLDLFDQIKAAETMTDAEKAKETPQQKQAKKIESSETALYKNQIIYESGDVARALAHLEKIEPTVVDKLAVQELRASYLDKLGRTDESLKAYLGLIDRNPNDLDYYHAVERLAKITSADQLTSFYVQMAKRYPKAEVPQARPLQFLQGPELEAHLREYVQSKITRKVPNTFALIKGMYSEHADLVDKVISSISRPSDAGQAAMWQLLVAQHLLSKKEYTKALEMIDSAIVDTPTILELYLAKARILRRQADLAGAAAVLEEAAGLDKGDRYLNSKAVKYAILAGNLDKAVELASIFPLAGGHTKDAMKHMRDLEAVDFLTRLARGYHEAADHGLALKNSLAAVSAFDHYYKDQYDFHFYGLKRGTVRAYMQLLAWEDDLYTHPRYIEAVEIAVAEYVALATGEPDGRDPEEVAALKKTRGKAAKKLAERVPEPPKEGEVPEEVDQDPFGAAILETKTPLDEAFRIWEPLSTARPDDARTWKIAFSIYLAQSKHLLALQNLKKARDFGASSSWVASAAVLARYRLENDADAPAALRTLQPKMLPTIATEGDIVAADLADYTDEYVRDNLLWAKTRLAIGKPEGVEKRLASTEVGDVKRAHEAVLLLGRHGLGDEMRRAVTAQWPRASSL